MICKFLKNLFKKKTVEEPKKDPPKKELKGIVTFSKGSNVQLTKNFNSDEMDCKYGDNEITKISIEHIEHLQAFRDHIGKPIKITSGYRNLKYNRSIGSKDTSQHLKGLATDIQVKGMPPRRVADAAEKFGFDGIGRYSSFTHLDSRGSRARWGKN